MRVRFTAAQSAIMMIQRAYRYAQDKEKTVTRVRYGRKTVKLLSGRKKLHLSFISDLEDELLERGWILCQTEEDFGLIREGSVNKWTKLSASRVLSDIRECREDEDIFDDLAANLEEEGLIPGDEDEDE
jgi:hypothetical protein